MSIIDDVSAFAYEKTRATTSKYGSEIFESHFVPAVKYGRLLAGHFDADEEIVEISLWLHDLGSIVYGRKDHHVTGAKIAGELLESLGYPSDRIEHVKQCIRHHRGSEQSHRETVEERIVADADTISCFDNLAGLFDAAFTYEKLSRKDARESVRAKLDRKWNKIHFDESKRLIANKYEAAMLLLSSD